ncbi:MAG: hypothetical protein LBT53_06485 [Puniceicoccales bacterium]|nr:hypothetical protein [Puniceicoccales bacterium]
MGTEKQCAMGSRGGWPSVPVVGICVADNREELIGVDGSRLPRLDSGAEADVYLDKKRGVVYKVFSTGENGTAGDIYFVNKNGRLDSRNSHDKNDLLEKIYVLNAIGGVPTEVTGRMACGELVVKQPYGWTENELSHTERYAVNARSGLSWVAPDVVPLDLFDSLYVTQTPEGAFLVGDLHEGNYLRNARHSGRILDLVTTRVTPEILYTFPKLEVLLKRNVP